MFAFKIMYKTTEGEFNIGPITMTVKKIIESISCTYKFLPCHKLALT